MVPEIRGKGFTMDDVGVFRTTIEIQNLDLRNPRQALPETMVDAGRGGGLRALSCAL